MDTKNMSFVVAALIATILSVVGVTSFPQKVSADDTSGTASQTVSAGGMHDTDCVLSEEHDLYPIEDPDFQFGYPEDGGKPCPSFETVKFSLEQTECVDDYFPFAFELTECVDDYFPKVHEPEVLSLSLLHMEAGGILAFKEKE